MAVLAHLTPVTALLAVLFALPWLVKSSLRFNARNTSYRNVRFDFHGNRCVTDNHCSRHGHGRGCIEYALM